VPLSELGTIARYAVAALLRHEAESLNERGTPHRVSGELARAEECHQQALELGRAIVSS
jgi:hypothetical protein